MVVWQGRSKRKPTGGRLKRLRAKRRFEYGKEPAHTKISSEVKVKKIRTRAGHLKNRILNAVEANVFNGKKMIKTKLVNLEQNDANRHFKRSNIITKGAIVNTELGKIKVTNRPGQEGQVQGILLKE